MGVERQKGRREWGLQPFALAKLPLLPWKTICMYVCMYVLCKDTIFMSSAKY